MDVPWGQPKHVRFEDNPKIQALHKSAEAILAIRKSEELVEEAICLGYMVSTWLLMTWLTPWVLPQSSPGHL